MVGEKGGGDGRREGGGREGGREGGGRERNNILG